MIVSVLTICVSADFMFEETDPYCTISGTTHNSFPGEISDTSSWFIPTVYEWECDTTPELSSNEKDKIFTIMLSFFEKYELIWPIYGEENWYGWSDTLNPKGQDFINDKFFPAIIKYISNQRAQENPNLKNIAILNYAVKTIGYDYFISQPE